MTAANREILERLFREGGIHLVQGTIFDRAPPPLPPDLDFGKVEGMMLGLAIGDALGNTTEGQMPSVRRERYGEIRDYLPNRHADGLAFGLPSDDSQLAFWTLEQMLDDGGFVPAHVAERLSRGRIFGIGSTMRQFLRNYHRDLPWALPLRRIAPSLLRRIAPLLGKKEGVLSFK
jgi:ADP-ribosyl-[dinitrogen reductase] hydrolase